MFQLANCSPALNISSPRFFPSKTHKFIRERRYWRKWKGFYVGVM